MIDLIALSVFSRLITKSLSRLIHGSVRNFKISLYAIWLFFFPGTLLHEFSHFLVAKLLGVTVSDMEFYPKYEKDTLKLGSVSVAKTDFFRKALISIAPTVIGVVALFLCIWYSLEVRNTLNVLQLFFVGFIVLQVSNTMFPSKKDLEGTWKFFLFVLVLFFVFAFFFGTNIKQIENTVALRYFRMGSIYFSIAVAIDLSLFGFIRILLMIQSKLR